MKKFCFDFCRKPTGQWGWFWNVCRHVSRSRHLLTLYFQIKAHVITASADKINKLYHLLIIKNYFYFILISQIQCTLYIQSSHLVWKHQKIKLPVSLQKSRKLLKMCLDGMIKGSIRTCVDEGDQPIFVVFVEPYNYCILIFAHNSTFQNEIFMYFFSSLYY